MLTAQGDWVGASPGSWSVICGHVMSEMTDGAVSATTHRVVPGVGRRRSVAYFLEPRRGASVLPWPADGEDDPEPRPGPDLRRLAGAPARGLTRGASR